MNRLNCAQLLFNEKPLRKIVFSYLRNNNVIYAPKTLWLDSDYDEYFENDYKIFENHRINLKFFSIFSSLQEEAIFEKCSELQLKAYQTIFKRVKLNKYQKSKIKRISLNHYIAYASIIHKRDYKYLKIRYYRDFGCRYGLGLETFTTKLKYNV